MREVLIRFRRGPAEFRASFQHPVLVWEAPRPAEGQHWEMTRSQAGRLPSVGDPRIFQVVKQTTNQHAFALGVTIGRVESNDIVLEDDSVSRFHAFLKFDEKGQSWFLTDADSKNGTWVDGVKMQPSERRIIQDGARMRLGDAELKFLLSSTLIAMLEK